MCDKVVDKCFSGRMRRKFRDKERKLTMEDLLRIAGPQEAVDHQMKIMVRGC